MCFATYVSKKHTNFIFQGNTNVALCIFTLACVILLEVCHCAQFNCISTQYFVDCAL